MSPPEMRIGDREREAAVAALGEHYVAGRLTKEEFDERSGVAWQARTSSDLAPLFVDLPTLQASRPPVHASAPQARPRGRRSGPPLLPVLLLAVVVVAVLDLAPWPLLLVLVILFVKLAAYRAASRANRHRGPHRGYHS